MSSISVALDMFLVCLRERELLVNEGRQSDVDSLLLTITAHTSVSRERDCLIGAYFFFSLSLSFSGQNTVFFRKISNRILLANDRLVARSVQRLNQNDAITLIREKEFTNLPYRRNYEFYERA